MGVRRALFRGRCAEPARRVFCRGVSVFGEGGDSGMRAHLAGGVRCVCAGGDGWTRCWSWRKMGGGRCCGCEGLVRW